MAIGIAYVKTAKGKEEAATKPGKLSGGLKALLGLITKTSMADLQEKLPQVPVDKLNQALDKLFSEGYIEIAAAVPTLTPGAKEEELDFTRFINRKVKEPTIQQKRKAEATLSGIKTSKKAGFHVNIINRPEKAIPSHAGGNRYTVLVLDADEANSPVVTRASARKVRDPFRVEERRDRDPAQQAAGGRRNRHRHRSVHRSDRPGAARPPAPAPDLQDGPGHRHDREGGAQPAGSRPRLWGK